MAEKLAAPQRTATYINVALEDGDVEIYSWEDKGGAMPTFSPTPA